jgi:hypothetical protein
LAVEYGGDESFADEMYTDDFPDDDEYVEYTVHRDDREPVLMRVHHPVRPPQPTSIPPKPAPRRAARPEVQADPESWRTILDTLLGDLPPTPAKPPKQKPNGVRHNGFDSDRQVEPEWGAETYRADIPNSEPVRPPPSDRRPFWFESNGRHSRD